MIELNSGMPDTSILKPNKTEYLQVRLKELGITDQLNTFTRTIENRFQNSGDQEAGSTTTREYKIFDDDDHGNIQIHYFNLNGQPYQYKKEGNKWPVDFVRKRLRLPRTDDNGKITQRYHQEKGSGIWPFFNPGIIKKYLACKESINIDGSAVDPIETLYLVEGEFKSFKGWMAGLDIVGLPSIHGFYNGDSVKGLLHEDLQELIITTGVQKIVFLVDADLLTLTWEPEKDLHTRPASFYGAIKAFRESLQLLIDNENVSLKLCYFMHIKTKYCKEDAKGLDDLLCNFPAMAEQIINDLHQHNYADKYFSGWSLLDQSRDVQGRTQKELGLLNEQEFYKTYQEYIGLREFKFKRKRYIYDNEKKEVVYVRHEDTDKFMRVGPDWVKVIQKQNKHGDFEEEIVPWKISEIIRDYSKKYPSFIDDIQKYDDFINEPNWSKDGYKRVHNGCLNLCSALVWNTDKPGSISNSKRFLKHIFQGSGDIVLDDKGNVIEEKLKPGDPFAVALDYLTLLLRHPKQMLPVPILVSPENGTGKSTFLKWLQLLFGSNMCILGNDQFKMKFNIHYITKFIIAIDEGFLEVDKKSEKERLKQLATADSAFMEGKGMNVRKINYYGKLIICSNDADRVMKIDEGESRWFVVRVPVIAKEDKDPDLELKLKKEAGAWLNYLFNRQIFHKREDRLWFKEEHFQTDQFRLIVESTKSRFERVFEEWIKDQFLMFRLPSLKFSIKNLEESITLKSKYRIDSTDLRDYLKKKKNMMPSSSPQGIKIPERLIELQDAVHLAKNSDPEKWELDRLIFFKSDNQRPYLFEVEDWLSEAELVEFHKKSLPEIICEMVLKEIESKGGFDSITTSKLKKYLDGRKAQEMPIKTDSTDDTPF